MFSLRHAQPVPRREAMRLPPDHNLIPLVLGPTAHPGSLAHPSCRVRRTCYAKPSRAPPRCPSLATNIAAGLADAGRPSLHRLSPLLAGVR